MKVKQIAKNRVNCLFKFNFSGLYFYLSKRKAFGYPKNQRFIPAVKRIKPSQDATGRKFKSGD